MTRRASALAWVLVLFCGFPLASHAQSSDHPLIAAPGFQPDRDYFSLQSFEHIDTLSGGLILTFSDLVLPGNAGRELRLQRTYNSKSLDWTFGVAGVAMRITEPPLPQGTPDVMEGTPTLHMSDGSAKRMAWSTPTSGTLTEATSRDFWKFNRSTRVLSVPNGDTCSYEVQAQYLLRVNYCHDVFGNLTDFSWTDLPADPMANPPLPARVELVVTQHLPPAERDITVIFDAGTGNPISMTYENETWEYESDANGLVTVNLPDTTGDWQFSYSSSGRLASVETPYGGQILYTYEEKQYAGPETPQVNYQTWVVSQRETSGHEIIAGTWTYSYEWQFGNGISLETTVESPSGRTIHKHGWPPSGTTPVDPREANPYAVFDAEAGLAPLRERIVEKDQGGGTWVPMQTEKFKYLWLKVLSWTDLGTLEIKERTLTQHDDSVDTDYKTEYEYTTTQTNYHADFHRPTSIKETGTAAGDRTTEYAYLHRSSPFVVGLVVEETTTVDTGASSESFIKSAEFDTLGFKTSETVYGITSTFARTPSGNVAWAEKGNGKRTTFTYEHGQVKVTRTPEYSITRTINPDGTIDTETRGGRLTSFDYDALGRLTEVQPPGGTLPITLTYDEAARTVTITRGGISEISVLDGFGRKISSVNATGVIVNTRYDAEGRVTYEGYPHKTGYIGAAADIGTVIEYDVLGRVTKRLHPDDTFLVREYHSPGAHVVITDERGEETTQEWKAYGDPSDASLATLLDASGTVWQYEYNGLKQLRTVKANSTAIRSRTYFTGTDRLQSETHPESGTTAYTYDLAGILSTKTDANNVTTTYKYDGNDRISSILAANRETRIAYEQGTDNRLWAVNQSSAVGWKYDAAGRLVRRQDRAGGKVFTTRFEYNVNDHLTALVYPSGRRIDFDADAEGRPELVEEQAASQEYAKEIAYHPSGALARYTAGNDVLTEIEYDDKRYWVESINSGPLELTYAAYDGLGTPNAIGDGRSGYDQEFEHDSLNRLIQAEGPYGVANFSYDLHGNRNGSGYVINGTTLRLTSQGTTSFTYDNNGNTLTAGSGTFTYTPFNQVETSANLGVTAAYAYDIDEQRISKTVGTSTTFYIHGPKGELLTEWTDPGTSGGRVRDYLYLGSRLLAAVARNTSEDPAGDDPPPPTGSHRYATSWQVPDGTDDNAHLGGGITSGARRSMHPHMPSTTLRLGVEYGTVAWLKPVGPLNSGPDPNPKQGSIFVEFEVERYPFSADAEWLGAGGCCTGSSTDDLRLYLTSSGELVLKHDAGQGTPQLVWTSGAVGLNVRHTLELRVKYNTHAGPFVVPNPPYEGVNGAVEVYFDGSPATTWSTEATNVGVNRSDRHLEDFRLKSPQPTNGLLMNVSRAGTTMVVSGSESMETYGQAWRTTLLEVAGPGTHSQWTGGSTNWQGRSAIRLSDFDPVTSNVLGQKVSYSMEPMLVRGVTGNIGTVMIGVNMSSVSANTKAFVRRNGVETILNDFVLGAGFQWYRVASSGWSPTDTVEVGVTNGANVTNSLNSVAILVEHDTPEPEWSTDTSVRVLTVNYTGNGAGQTIDFGVDAMPTAMIVMPVAGVTGVEPMTWWESRLGAAPFSIAEPNFRKLWPQPGRFNVSHTSAKSYNANGVEYIAIAMFDPSSRFVLPFSVAKPVAEDNYTHLLRYPQTGEPANTFTPDFMFGGAAYYGADTTRASYYRGPGHAGDLTGKLGVATASDADRIQSISQGAVQLGTAVSSSQGDHAFLAGRVSDGVASTRLMAVTSYVGNGAASRNITLNLSGASPTFVLVVPTNATAKAYRVTGGTGGRRTDNGNALANSITAMTADQITVGAALNATGVTYDVWAIRTGIVP